MKNWYRSGNRKETRWVYDLNLSAFNHVVGSFTFGRDMEYTIRKPFVFFDMPSLMVNYWKKS